MNFRVHLNKSTTAFVLSLGLWTSASATQVDLGPMVPGISMTHLQSFSGVLDDTLTFTLAAEAMNFRGSANSAFSIVDSIPLTIQDFNAVLVGPNGYRSRWEWSAANLGGFGIPFFVESVIGREDTLAAGTYSLHLTGTGLVNDAYDLHLGVSAVPEPAAGTMALAGLTLLAVMRRRRPTR